MNVDILVGLMNQLTQGAETFLHTHPRHVIDADDVSNYQRARNIVLSVGNYIAKPNDEIFLVDTSAGNVTITLPHSDFKKEYQVVKISGANIMFVVPTPPDTIMGSTIGVSATSTYTSLNFKMDTLRKNWFLI